MNIHEISIDSNKIENVNICACIGYFDGLHLGHQRLVSKCIEMSDANNCESALITFNPDPWVTIKGLTDLKHLTTMQDRQQIAKSLGIQHFIILDFNAEMAKLSADDFVLLLKEKLNIKGIVCGFDFHYGKNGLGDKNSLTNHGLQVYCADSVNDDSGKISSTRICDYLLAGEITMANKLLDYKYHVSGKVIHGNNKGSKIGFPTANIKVDSEYIIPSKGVYIATVTILNKQYQAMVNIGHNPTFNYCDKFSVEVNIIDFSQMIYDENITISFCHKIRDEIKFDNVDKLVNQLQADKNSVLNYFKQNEDKI